MRVPKYHLQALAYLVTILILWTGRAEARQTYQDDLWAFDIADVTAWTNETRAQGEPTCGSPCDQCNQTNGPYAFNTSGTAVLNARSFRRANGSPYAHRSGTRVTSVGVEVLCRYDTGDTGTIRVDVLNSVISGYHWTNTKEVRSPDAQCRFQMGSDGDISGTWGWNDNPDLYLNGFQVQVRRQSSPSTHGCGCGRSASASTASAIPPRISRSHPAARPSAAEPRHFARSSGAVPDRSVTSGD